ncbi:MAG: helix-turn-helix domain-containing protein [Chitinivibrionales bacterium]|nr:helix-turn-helix domain-containing protein [Chitinivibrionales bacterium]
MKNDEVAARETSFSDALERVLFRFELGYVQPIDERASRCPFHHHACTEIVYHLQGGGTTALDNGRKVTFDEGGVVIYPPGMVHNQLTGYPAADVVVQVEALNPSALEPHGCLYVPPPIDPLSLQLITELGNTPSQVDPASNIGLSLKASVLMHHLLGSSSRAEVSEAGQDSREVLVARAHDHIRNHHRAIRRMADVADELGTDYDRLRREFRAVYGYTMKAWLRQVRLEQAKALLRNTVLPQSVVADLCGYADEQYFCCDFKKLTGETPGRFRRAVQRHL